jgi:hypothetical protein
MRRSGIDAGAQGDVVAALVGERLAYYTPRGHHGIVRCFGPMAILGVLALGGCRERNPAFMPDAVTSSGPSPGSSEGSTGFEPTSTTGSASAGSTTSPSESSSSAGEPGTSSETSSDPSGGDGSYPPCDLDADPQCPRGWDECISVDDPPRSWCAHPCEHDHDCEDPASGDAEPVCAGPSGESCALDCSDGQDCPDGMDCDELFEGVVRCVWPG